MEGPHLRVLFPPGHQHLCRGYSGRKFRLEAKLASFSVLVAAGTGDREADGWEGVLASCHFSAVIFILLMKWTLHLKIGRISLII